MSYLSYLKSEESERRISELFCSRKENYEREFWVFSPHSGVSYVSASAEALLGRDGSDGASNGKGAMVFDARELALTVRGEDGAVRAAEVNSAIGAIPALVTYHFTGERIVWLLPELCNLATDRSYPTVMRRLCRFFRGIPQIIDKAVRSGAKELSGEMLADFMQAADGARCNARRLLTTMPENGERERFCKTPDKQKNGKKTMCDGVDGKWLHKIRRKTLESAEAYLDVTAEGGTVCRKSIAVFRMLPCGSVAQYGRLLKNIMKSFKECCDEEERIDSLSSDRFLAILTLAISACLRLKPDCDSSMRIEETEDELILSFDRIQKFPNGEFSWAFTGLILKALGAESCVEEDGTSCFCVRMRKNGEFIVDVRRPRNVRFFGRINDARDVRNRKYVSSEEYFCFIGGLYNAPDVKKSGDPDGIG